MTSSDDNPTPDADRPGIDSGHAAWQLGRALEASRLAVDGTAVARADKRVSAWRSVLEGLQAGLLSVGSRQPVGAFPAWVTLEVVTGGFATGRALAGGPLAAHEVVASHPGEEPAALRLRLNTDCLTEPGLVRLQAQLASRRYAVDLPEEAALLTVAWLVGQGQVAQAAELVRQIGPFFSTLRFYPAPADEPEPAGLEVSLETVGDAVRRLSAVTPCPRLQAQKEAIRVWAPLYDEAVGLWLDTVEGEVPQARRTVTGAWERSPQGGFSLTGGWPCRRYPSGWNDRARDLLDRIKRARVAHPLCRRPDDPKDSFAQATALLRQAADAPESLTGREVGRVRLLIGRYVAKRGLPGSPDCASARHRQVTQVSRPAFHDIARALVSRLQALRQDRGLDDPAPFVAPLAAEEAAHFQLPPGTAVPDSLRAKIERCRRAEVEVLVAHGLVTSGDTLARLLPQVSAGWHSAAVADPTLRALCAATYRAFRRRRSLLLLDLQKQVGLEELPWVAAVAQWRLADTATQASALKVLREVAALAIGAFPQAILPNKLLQELSALATAAGMSLPLVEEVAADIFMGRFSDKFADAARLAAQSLQGTLYAASYGIDAERLLALRDGAAFSALCHERARAIQPGARGVAASGMVIEQQMVLTTHNLAVLFSRLGLPDLLDERRLASLARRCWVWVCRRLQVKPASSHAALVHIKNAAYAWRQMVFFLSQLTQAEAQRFLTVWAPEHLARQPRAFQRRFGPALEGLVVASRGGVAPREPMASPFLGWSAGGHWLMQRSSG